MSMIAWRSGRRTRRPVRRLLPIIVFAFTVSAAFGVASIFSSNVTSETTNQVLLKGTRCGVLDSNKPTEDQALKQLTQMIPYDAERAYQFLNYGKNCYTNATHTDGCNLYIKSRLPLNSQRNQSCPFGDNICKLENDNLLLDSGLLDSQQDLGINTPSDKRFQFRLVNHCAPIKTEGYVEQHNDSEYGPVNRYMYGFVLNERGGTNWSYELATNNTFLPADNTSSRNIPRLDYNLGTDLHYATPNESLLDPGTNTWSPIPALHRDDADVHMLYLSAPEVHFSMPVNDPWINANKSASEFTDKDDNSIRISAWEQNEPVGVLSCALQVQYCNPNLQGGEQCEPLRGIMDPRKSDTISKIFPDENHFQIIKWVEGIWIPSLYTISNIVAFIGAPALQARSGMTTGVQGPLPDNQWQLEAENWVKGGLASLQDIFVTTANGLPEDMEDFRAPPAANNTAAQNMCVNQKIVSTTYSSFNILGLSLILILGAWIVLLDMGLEPTVAWWQRRRYMKHQLRDQYYGYGKGVHPLYPTLEWSHSSILQLQRLAHEEAGFGTWAACDRDVPVTKPGEMLSNLDLRDVRHPTLQKHSDVPASQWDEVTPFQQWGMRRTETGLDTLVEDIESDKAGPEKTGDEVVVQVVDAREGRRGRVSPVSPVSQGSPTRPGWTVLR